MTVRGPLAIGLFAALFVSLAVNLGIAGFAFSRFAGPPPLGEIERIVSIGTRAFPPEIQKAIADGSRDKRDQIKQLIDAAKDARRKMFEAMRADPFDAAALNAAYADLRDKTTAVQQAGQDIVADAVAGASAEVRSRIRMPHGPFP